MRRFAGSFAAVAAGVALALASPMATPLAAQQFVDVQKKIDSLIGSAIEAQLRHQLGVSTDSAPHVNLDYDAGKITNQIVGHPTMTFTPSGLPTPTQAFVGCMFGCNSTDTEESNMEFEYRHGDEVSQSSEWSVALKVSSGFKFGGNVDFEGLGGIEEEVEMGVSLTTEFMGGQENSESIEWKSTFSVNVPAHKSLQGVMVVEKVSFSSVSFTLDTELKGGANIPNLSYAFTDSHGKTVKSGKTTLAFQIEDAYPNAADRTVSAKGAFTGDQWGTQASYYTFNEVDRADGQCPPPEGAPACPSTMPSNATLAGKKAVTLPNN